MTLNRDDSAETVLDWESQAEQSSLNGQGSHDLIPDLEDKLRNQVKKWQSKLLDLGNRNPLINASFSASRGVVELVSPDTETIWKKLASEGTAGSDSMKFPWRRDLVPPPAEFLASEAANEEAADKKRKEWNPPLQECLASKKRGDRDLMTSLGDLALDRRLRTLDGYAHLSLSEQGVHCLYVAFGFLKWFESVDSDVEHYSPLMLVPMSLSRSSADAPWELVEAEDDAIDNRCLRERLKQDFGLELPELPDIDDLEEEGARLQYLDAVRRAVAANDRWEVQDRCALGRFAFPKIAMWQDLGTHVDSVLSNVLCRSIGGDESIPPKTSFGMKSSLPEAATLDDAIAPGEIKTILDCDSSQLEAIIAARSGVSFVLDGPPGTGKSQTIANIIADALSEGRRVLFVSEKVSALEVVKRRLDDCGLGDFCLECHSSKANRKAVLDELKYCLDLPVEVYDDVTPKLDEAKQKRSSLNSYVRSIHRRRPPLGLSPYELYGHVSRAHRLGHAAKSRCGLPGLEDMDRVRFENWMQLLDRANESAEEIRHHPGHPWRGCRLTTRTLSLSDELQQHLNILAAAFASVDQALSPLVQRGILAENPTPMTLSSVRQSLRDAQNVPQIPADWFSSPQEVATAVLRLSRNHRALSEQRNRLSDFVEDIENRWPESLSGDALRNLNGPAEWQQRFVAPVPQTVRKQTSFLESHQQDLQRLITSLEKVTAGTESLVDLLPFPIRADIPPYKLPALIEVASLVAAVHPLRPEWLVSENWPTLRAACQNVLAMLDEAAEIVKRLDGRLEGGQLLALSQATEPRSCLVRSWESAQSFFVESHVDQLADGRSHVENAISVLRDIQRHSHAVLEAWSITAELPVSLTKARRLRSAIPQSIEMVGLSGMWRDPVTRAKLRTSCTAAISDLREAADVREQLEERLSHRAFKPSALELVNRAPQYQSIWKRWFGGFGAYRQEVAELFKSGCPSTPILLSDLLKLRTWHRRVAEVTDSASEVARWLPTGFVADQLESWEQLQQSLSAFEQFASDLTDIVILLPDESVMIDQRSLAAIHANLTSSLEQVESLEQGRFRGLLDDRATISELIQDLGGLAAGIADCQKSYDELAPLYSVAPRTLKTLIADCQLAERYAEIQNTINNRHKSLVDLLPPELPPTDRSLWRGVERGVAAAERLGKVLRSPQDYQDTLCKADGIDASELAMAAGNLLSAYKSMVSSFESVCPRFQLLPEELSPQDIIRRGLADVTSAAKSSLNSIEERLGLLTASLHLLRSDADVRVEFLPTAASTVTAVQTCLREHEICLGILKVLNVDPNFQLPDGGDAEAAWLLEQVDAERLSPLARSVATSSDVRREVAASLDACEQALGGDFPGSFKFLRDVFSIESPTGRGVPIPKMSVGELSTFLGELCSSLGSLDEWLKFSRWRRDMEEQGFGAVVEELLNGHFAPEETKSIIAARFFRLVFDHFANEDRLLGEFDLEAHEQSRERFRKLDDWEVRVASSRIRQYQLGRDDRPRLGLFTEGSSELGILQREIQKKRRQLPLRKLFAAVPSVLQRLKPCVMMSPLSVSTFLQSDEIRFDLVIFDEASQVFPWDAIGAIYRGDQLIVAGDEKQLPPTNFFNRADLESAEEEDSDIGDYESILSLCKSIGMPGRGLRWHYRSRREPLIAFSNRHFYSGDLVTFPSIRDASSDAVRLEFVPQGRWIDRANLPEAERVTDLVIQHLRGRPETSLGIIAFNQSQQTAIEDAIYERRRKYPEVESLFHLGLSEPLFIKNLENVQGDERDVIILSMGYGYNDAGKFLKNFGPLTKSGGERRLNVAVTRAREEVILVASVKSSDMDLSGSTSLGANLLKGYLEYAERGVDALARAIDSITGEAESTFEQEVATALIERGLHPVLQVGCGGFRIDMALKHPQRPGEFCLGIECDGATYHSSKTARDRDRIRQNVLEQLGWNIVRVWSTDWIRNPERQLDRVLSAYEKACATARASVREEVLDVDDDLIDLVPRYQKLKEKAGPVFKAIKDVPETHLRDMFQKIVKSGGAIDAEGLIQQASRELGFARTGKLIRSRLEASLNELLQVGHLRWIGERIGSIADQGQ